LQYTEDVNDKTNNGDRSNKGTLMQNSKMIDILTRVQDLSLGGIILTAGKGLSAEDALAYRIFGRRQLILRKRFNEWISILTIKFFWRQNSVLIAANKADLWDNTGLKYGRDGIWDFFV
jgi:hypothetical protein